MTDPRNVAHDKKVIQEKKHHGVDVSAGTHHATQPGKKSHMDPVVETNSDAGHAPDADEAQDKVESGNEP